MKNEKRVQGFRYLDDLNHDRLKEDISWEKGVTLPLYFGLEVRIALRKITDLRKQIVGPFKTYRAYIVTVGVLILVASLSLFLTRSELTLGATYNFVQTDWSGGASANNATHSTNRTGWTEYSSASTTLTMGSTITLSSGNIEAFTETTDSDFSDGTLTSTEVSGSGSSANITLSTNLAFTSGTYSGNSIGTQTEHDLIGNNYVKRIFSVGSYVYVLFNQDGLRIFDASNPTAWAAKGAYDGGGNTYRDMHVEGNYAYLLDATAGLYIVNISDPTNITLTGSIDTVATGSGYGVYKSGDYVYIAEINDGVDIIDVSTLSSPSYVTTYSTGLGTSTDAYDLVVQGNYVYVALGSTELLVLDVSTPGSPSVAATVTGESIHKFITSSNSDEIRLLGTDHVLIGNDYGFGVIDITTPTSPNTVSVVYGVRSDSITVTNSNTVSFTDGLQHLTAMYDLTDKTQPKILGFASYNGEYDALQHGYLDPNSNTFFIIQSGSYYSDWSIYRTATYTAPTDILGNRVGTIYPQNTVYTPEYVTISGTTAYISVNGAVELIDVTDPSSPTYLGYYDNSTQGENGVAVSGNYMFVNAGIYLDVVNISNPASPSLVTQLNIGQVGYSMHLSGDYLYIPMYTGMAIVNISNPESPSLTGSYTSSTTNGYDVVTNGNYAYLANGTDGLRVIDISNPASPSVVGTYDPGAVWDVEVIGGYVYIATGSIEVVDVSTPSSPTQAATISASAQDIVADGNYALASGGGGYYRQFYILDVSTPASPVLEAWGDKHGQQTASQGDYGAAFSNGYIYLPSDDINTDVTDIFQLYSYSTSGSYTSSIITSANSEWGTASWTTSEPSGTSITVKARTDSNSDMSGATAWGSCTAITSGNDISSNGCVTDGQQYIQYQLTYTSNSSSKSPTLSDITVNKTGYETEGSLISSPFDSESAENVIGGLQWTENLPSGTNIKFQIRSAPDSSGSPGTWGNWLGPTDGTDFYTDPTGAESAPSAHTDGSNDEWMQYRVTLTGDGTGTPTLSDATLVYVVNAQPEFQSAATASQQSDGTIDITYSVRDTDTSTGTATPGYVTPSFEYSIDDGSTWNAVTTGLSANATSTKAVDASTYTQYTATWTAKNQIDGTYDEQFKIKVTVDDGEGANNTASSTTATFTVDVKDPVPVQISVQATSTPAIVTHTATDDNTITVKAGLTSDLTGYGYQAYTSTSSLALATDPDTVYVQFKDSFGNETTIQNTVTPETPTYPIVRDVTNVNDPPTYQLFVSWRAVSEPADGFGAYYVWRSTDGSVGSLLQTITDRTQNYILDTGLDTNTSYYYRISTQDNGGNGSYMSGQVVDTPDGQGGTDATPPTISNVAATEVSSTGAKVTWDTDELSNSTVGYSTTAGDFDTEVGVATYVDSSSGVGNHTVYLTGLTPGTTYYFQAKSTDPESNIDTDNNGGDGYTFTTLSGPVISSVSASSVLNTKATITWNTDIAAPSAVYYSTNSDLSDSTTMSSATEVTEHAVTLTGLTGGTTYYFYVNSDNATDNNGGNYYSFTTTQDSTAPVITSVDASPVADTYALISWLTNEPASSKVSWGTSTGSYSSASTTSELNTRHAMNLTGLTKETKYYYVVTSTDGSGNTATSTESTFTTQEQLYTETQTENTAAEAVSQSQSSGGGGGGASQDYTAPTILNIGVTDITDRSVVVNWETNEQANCFVQFGRVSEDEYEQIHGNWVFRTDHSVALNDLEPGTTYNYRVVSGDKAGNISQGPEQTFTTAGAGSTLPDIDVGDENTDVSEEAENSLQDIITKATSAISSLASRVSDSVLESTLLTQNDLIRELSSRVPTPIISGEPRVEVTASTATIYWTTDKESNSLVAISSEGEYNTNSEEPYRQIVGNADELTQQHSVTIANLAPDTVYHYQIRSRTAVSSYAQSGDYTFRTNRKSLEISNYAIEQLSDTEVIFRWSTNIESTSLIRYIPYRNNIPAIDEVRVASEDTLTTIHQIEVNDFEPGVIYDIELVSEDRTGTITTQEINAFSTSDENRAPIISQIKTDTAIAAADENRIQAIISWATNEPSTSKVYYQKGIGDENSVGAQSTIVDNNYTKKHVVVITDFEPGTVYQFRVESTDSTGQVTTSSKHTLLTPRQQESVFQIIITNFENTFGWINVLRR